MKRIITIQVTFGSKFEQDVAMRRLGEVLTVWKQTTEASHKKNKITIKDVPASPLIVAPLAAVGR
jgi:hypothetical protein